MQTGMSSAEGTRVLGVDQYGPADFKNKYFPVLDAGFVALKDFMGSDEDIVAAARVSYGAGTRKISADRALIRMLLRNRHTTPFEQVQLKFHVKLPIFVARQLIRHRTASVNEYSMRYSLAPMQFYIPEFENYQKQSKTNRQGRTDQADREVYDRVRVAWEELQKAASEVYQEQILEDIAREIARIHLPLSLYTEWIWCIDLHNLLHFLGLRADSHAQWEIQEFAKVKAGLAKIVAPLAFEAWIDYRHCATSLSRMEWNVLRTLVVNNLHGGGRIISKGIGTMLDTHMRHAEKGFVDEDGLKAFGLDKREIDELLAKFNSTDDEVPIPDYTLNLDDAKPPEYFLERARAAVPERIRDK